MKINMLNDAVSIARSGMNEKGLARSYENLKKLVQPRHGFHQVGKTEYAVIPSDRITDLSFMRFENSQSGMKEHVVADSSYVERVLYNKDNNPVGAVLFDKTSDGARDGFVGRVFESNEDGSIVEILADGTRKQRDISGETNFEKAFDMNRFGILRKKFDVYFTHFFK